MSRRLHELDRSGINLPETIHWEWETWAALLSPNGELTYLGDIGHTSEAGKQASARFWNSLHPQVLTIDSSMALSRYLYTSAFDKARNFNVMEMIERRFLMAAQQGRTRATSLIRICAAGMFRVPVLF
jgi:hypothetical protein